jgi:hypothetical protein
VKPEGKLKELVDIYKRGREVPRVSIEVELKGKKYRELNFYAVSIIGKKKDLVNGLVFVDEKDNVVKDKRLQGELSTVFLNLEQLLDMAFIEKLAKTIINKKSPEIDEAQNKSIEANLLYLATRNIYGAEIVRDIVLKLPELKKTNNAAVEKFIEKAKEFNKSEIVGKNNELLELKLLYTDTLMKNFEKVKLIGTGRSFYDGVRKGAAKVFRNKITGSIGSKLEGSAVTLDYELNHLMRIVKAYEMIIDMSTSEYQKYLKELDKRLINEKNEKNRA